MKIELSPSVQLARRASFVVLVLAIAVSGYLSWLKISNERAVCVQGGRFDCGTVLSSAYSELGGIPIAWLGLATNLIVVAILLAETRIAALRSYSAILAFAVVLFAFLFSVYLVYVQAFLIQAFCVWCLTHEALIAVLFGIVTWRLITELRAYDEPELAEAE
jgi:uncharacterized membrane protein